MTDDPYDVRERTHRYDGFAFCRRCAMRWPCPKAGETDSDGGCFAPLVGTVLLVLVGLASVAGFLAAVLG